MSVTRQAVLEQLAKQSDAGNEEMTSVSSIVAALNCDEQTASGHLEHLDACELARLYSNGRVRVTITGEELLELDTGEGIIIDPETNMRTLTFNGTPRKRLAWRWLAND